MIDTLKSKYNFKLPRKQQLIDVIKINPSIYDKLNKDDRNLIKNESSIQHIIKSDEYGLFERKILNFKKFLNVNVKLPQINNFLYVLLDAFF